MARPHPVHRPVQAVQQSDRVTEAIDGVGKRDLRRLLSYLELLFTLFSFTDSIPSFLRLTNNHSIERLLLRRIFHHFCMIAWFNLRVTFSNGSPRLESASDGEEKRYELMNSAPHPWLPGYCG